MTPTKLFLFDLDGTLVSTGGAGLRALDQAFQDLYDIPNVISDINPSGKTDPAIFREIIRKKLTRDMKENEFEQISQSYLGYLEKEMQSNNDLVILPGVIAFLDALRSKNVCVALGTGNLEKGARLKLSPTPLNGYFAFGGFGSDAEERSEVLKIGHKRAEKHLGHSVSSQNVYVVGDTLLDVLAAQKAGFKTISVATGNKTPDELKKGNPNFLFNNLTEASNLLAGLN